MSSAARFAATITPHGSNITTAFGVERNAASISSSDSERPAGAPPVTSSPMARSPWLPHARVSRLVGAMVRLRGTDAPQIHQLDVLAEKL